MDDLDFTAPIDNAINMQMDILCDIYCWQQIILDRMAHLEAEKNDCLKEDVMEVWERKKLAIRQHLLEQLYNKHGPDLSKDVGL